MSEWNPQIKPRVKQITKGCEKVMMMSGGWSYSPETEEVRREERVREVICVRGEALNANHVVCYWSQPHSIAEAGGQLETILKKIQESSFRRAFLRRFTNQRRMLERLKTMTVLMHRSPADMYFKFKMLATSAVTAHAKTFFFFFRKMWVRSRNTFNETTAVREQFFFWALFLFKAVAADKKNNLGEHLGHERKQPTRIISPCSSSQFAERKIYRNEQQQK